MFNIRCLSLKTCQDLLDGWRPPLFHITSYKGFISRFHLLPVSVEELEGKKNRNIFDLKHKRDSLHNIKVGSRLFSNLGELR